MILDAFPSPEEFYKTYWNKKPFAVRGGVDPAIFETLIDADTLAGLSLEEDIKSRLIITQEGGGKWACEHGPFDDDRYENIGDKNWSLLVQNVEQYHTETSALLQHFNFAPRWLMDDIMVSYSATGGSVGPHIDSYHVFLTQGMGKRQWKVSNAAIENVEYIEGQDLKVLKHPFDGETIEVTTGDVIYIPPHFAHEGITLDHAMTFSVGFLGPTQAEIFADFAYHLEQVSAQNKRYSGTDLNAESAQYSISNSAQTSLQNDLIAALQSNEFSIWLAEYFSKPTHDDIESLDMREEALSEDELIEKSRGGAKLYKPDHIKLTITQTQSGEQIIAVLGLRIPTQKKHAALIRALNENQILSGEIIEKNIDVIASLYNHFILEFASEDGNG